MTANPFRAAQRAVKGEMDRLEGLRALFEVLGEGADIQKAVNDKRDELDAVNRELIAASAEVGKVREEGAQVIAAAQAGAKQILAAAEATKAEVTSLIDEAREEGRRVIAEAREAAKREAEGAALVLAGIREEIANVTFERDGARDALAEVRATIDNEQARLFAVRAEIDALKKRFA